MKVSVGVLLAFVLPGCITDPKQPTAKCALDAKRTYPEKTLFGASPSIEMAHSSNFVCVRLDTISGAVTISRLAVAMRVACRAAERDLGCIRQSCGLKIELR
jgi:hypothetical protein